MIHTFKSYTPFIVVIKYGYSPVCFTIYVLYLVVQPCLTLYDTMDCNPPGSSVHGILQVRILQWLAIPFYRGSSQLRSQAQVSCTIGRFFTVWASREALYNKYPCNLFYTWQLVPLILLSPYCLSLFPLPTGKH